MPSEIGLLDCNHFYVSAERVFHPAWAERPMVVLSNNDGCIIARSPEVKALGVPMGAPIHEHRKVLERHGTVILSSNFALYGDLSRRVMDCVAACTPELEVYSIDEAFLSLRGFAEPVEHGRRIIRTVRRWTGIPTCIGIAPTKTLAKLANRIAKQEHIPGGCFALSDPDQRDHWLPRIAVEDVWGIGPRWAAKLNELGIHSAGDLRELDPHRARRWFSVVLARTVLELRGIPCLSLDEVEPPKQQLIASRSFGRPVTTRQALSEALAWHASRAAVKLRRQDSRCGAMQVFIHTNPFRPDNPQYRNAALVRFAPPSADTARLIAGAQRGLGAIFRSGYAYHKCGIMLLDLSTAGQCQGTLFEPSDTPRRRRLMATVDRINRRFGRGTLRFAAEGIEQPWAMRRSCKTPSYTTRWNELVTVD